MMNLLLLSSSRAHNSEYLAPNLQLIDEFLGSTRSLLFIPYAGVRIQYDDYQAMVQTALTPLGIQVDSSHRHADPALAVANAQAICVGGGNTFVLLQKLYELGLMTAIRQKSLQGTPYLGWSAGSNIAGPTIRTTNDMPIVAPPSFDALNLVPFQLNPHYTDFVPVGFHGETRDMRLAEFMTVDPLTPILGLPEGCALHRQGSALQYIGNEPARLFLQGEKTLVAANTDVSSLLER